MLRFRFPTVNRQTDSQAVQFFQKMVDLRPQLSSYSRVSYMRELHGDLIGAIDSMKMAISAGGSRESVAWAHVHLGNLYITTEQYPTAQREFDAALSDFPDYAQAYAGLGNLSIAQGHESVPHRSFVAKSAFLHSSRSRSR
jgi:Tfp pilus assembly protein PilF